MKKPVGPLGTIFGCLTQKEVFDEETGKNKTEFSDCHGFYCAVNTTNPAEHCPEGFYCPNNAEKHKCPKNKWCMKGMREPLDCPHAPYLQSCPEGSSKQGLNAFGIVILVIVLVSLGVLNMVLKVFSKDDSAGFEKEAPPTPNPVGKNAKNPVGSEASEDEGAVIVEDTETTFHGFEKKDENMTFQFEDLGETSFCFLLLFLLLSNLPNFQCKLIYACSL
jgi:hypothetical protein